MTRSTTRRRLIATRVLVLALILAPTVGKVGAEEIRPPWRYEPGQLASRLRNAVSDRWSRVRLVPESLWHDPEVERTVATVMTGPTTTQLWWWQVPARARRAARGYASRQGLRVSRVVRVVEPDGKAHFDIYGGPYFWERGKQPETVLVSVDDVTSKAHNTP